ncbi:MAG: hypothetical protein GX468_01530 [Thermotogaceae bacterium]|nr:hypothetical protein [Thermotogaceae bacterium]
MGIKAKLSLFCTMIFLMSLTVGTFGVSFFVPSNSDFVIFASGFTDFLGSNDDSTLGSMMIFGKDSTGPLIFNNLYTIMSGDVENLGDVELDLSDLPIGVIFGEGTSEDSIIEILSYLSYSTPEIVDLSESEKEIIAGANEFFIVKSGKRYYLCFSDVSRRFVKDMFSGKLSKTAIEIPDDFVFYYKSLKGAPLGEMLYSFGDFYGKPVSEELSARMIDGKLTFDLTIKKETTEYEKSLIKESEVSAIDDLDVIKDADMIINGVGELGYAFAYGLLNLSGVELKRNYFESFIFSSSSKHDTVLFSAKYNSDCDKETLDRMVSELSDYFGSVVVQEERQVVNAFSGFGMYLGKMNKEAQNKIFYLMCSQELFGLPLQIDLTRMDDGGLKLSGSIDNITMIPTLLELFFLSNNTNYDETTTDEYGYDEYGTTDEYWYDEYGTTDETTTDEYGTTEDYSYGDETEDTIIENLLYLIDDCYSSLSSAYGPLTKEDLRGSYDDWFLDRINVASVDTGNGYREYVMIVYSTTDFEDLDYIAESVSDQSWAAYMVDGNNIVFVVTMDYNNAAQ